MNIEKGYIDAEIPDGIDLKSEIRKMCIEKNAVILAHFYQKGDVQDIADFVGDSLDLSRKAAETDADVIVFAGVKFMAETAKVLSPEKTVLLPDLNAGCSLADSCLPSDFKAFTESHPDHLVITYVNTTAAIKALSNICCTSTNAVAVVESLPVDQKIIFAPDKNLGNYINGLTGRNMLLWDGACHVHEEFSLERILLMKKEFPEAKIICHPECQKPVQIVSDFIGSTSALLKYVQDDATQTYIVATESGILHQMRKNVPLKMFLPAPPNDSTCACNDCEYMKLNTLEKLYNCMKYMAPEIILTDDLRFKAEIPIRRMLEID
ncbi:MAG: quinolinate synthase NadA [Bacteroidales bacterium]|nr:quinolinate synthase NadA [Bacteroidales bacterium]